MKTNTKRYLISSLITFTSAFLIGVASVIDTITIDNVGKSAVLGLLVVGVRAGVKALAEWLVSSK